MPAPIIGTVAKAILGKSAREIITKAAEAEGAGEFVKRAKRASDDIYNARRRAKRAEGRVKSAIHFLEHPEEKATKAVREYASQFTREELERLQRSYGDTVKSLTAKVRGEYTERQLQAAARENEIYEYVRKAKPRVTLREKSIYERLEKSPASRDVVWSLVNKQLARESGGQLGRRPTVDDIRRIGKSDNLEEALNNIFQDYFQMDMSDAEFYDSVNHGNQELYEMLQFTIITGKPRSEERYKEKPKTGWYEPPKNRRPKARKRKRSRKKR